MKKQNPFFTILLFSTIICLVAFCTTFVISFIPGGNNATFFEKIQIGNLTLYRYDFRDYIKQLNQIGSFDSIWQAINIETPKTIAREVGGADFLADIAHNLVAQLDIIIFIVNIVFLAPIKFIAWLITLITSLIGFNISQGGNANIIGTILNVINSVQIPQI